MEGLDVLDLGCGFGGLAVSALDREARSYVGIANVQEHLDVARRELGAMTGLHSTEATFLLADMEAVPDLQRKFDLVVACESIWHSDLEATLESVRRVLIPTGAFVVIDDFSSPTLPVDSTTREYVASSWKMSFPWSMEALLEVATQYGLAIEAISELEADTKFVHRSVADAGAALLRVCAHAVGGDLKALCNFLAAQLVLHRLHADKQLTYRAAVFRIAGPGGEYPAAHTPRAFEA